MGTFRKYDILTDFKVFCRFLTGFENASNMVLMLGTTPEFLGERYCDYIYHIINQSQPNLDIDFLDKFDECITARAAYRVRMWRTGHNLSDVDVNIDNYNYVREQMKEYIDINEEDVTCPKSLLTSEEYNEAVGLYDTTNKECLKYIFKKTKSSEKAQRYIELYIKPFKTVFENE